MPIASTQPETSQAPLWLDWIPFVLVAQTLSRWLKRVPQDEKESDHLERRMHVPEVYPSRHTSSDSLTSFVLHWKSVLVASRSQRIVRDASHPVRAGSCMPHFQNRDYTYIRWTMRWLSRALRLLPAPGLGRDMPPIRILPHLLAPAASCNSPGSAFAPSPGFLSQGYNAEA